MKTRRGAAAENLERCKEFLRRGAALEPSAFMGWWETSKSTVATDIFADDAHPFPHAVRRQARAGGAISSKLFGRTKLTFLHFALKYSAPDAVTLAIAEEWPGAAKVQNEHKNTPLHLALWNSRTKHAVSEEVVLKLIQWCPEAVHEGSHTDDGPVSTLFAALLARAPPAVVLAILEAAPAIVRVLNPSNGETALHCALQGLDHDAYIDDGQRHGDANGNPRQPEEEDAVLLPLIAAWPESVAMRPNDDDDQATHTRTPLHYAMVYGASATVVKAMVEACPEALAVHEHDDGHLPLHDSLESKVSAEAVTLLLIDAHPDAAKAATFIRDDQADDDAEPITPALLLAFAHKRCNSERVIRALAAAAPESARSLEDGTDCTILHLATQHEASNRMVQLAIELWPEAVSKKSAVEHGVGNFQGVTYGGNTPLHDLALWHPSDDGSTDADRRRKNEICCTLVHAGASLLERNAAGQTAEEATYNSASYNLPCEKAAGGNRHLRATLKEMRMFRGLPHLGNEHFRHWTTVSHAWCPPSAKLTALTVLLVGCSFKRLAAERKLPRLPMDCWYRILNCIPRHELRQGDFAPEGETIASAEIAAIMAACCKRGS